MSGRSHDGMTDDVLEPRPTAGDTPAVEVAELAPDGAFAAALARMPIFEPVGAVR